MHQARLNDAAIALSRILDKQPIYFGFFGGYAINAYGGQRECKDIDCIADATKQQIINVLDGKEGFVKAPIQTTEDYVAFLWSEQPNRQNPVLVEIWCDQFPGKFIRTIPFLSFNPGIDFLTIFSLGAKHLMSDVRLVTIPINGQVTGFGASSFLNPFHIFKGKIHAAAGRANYHDAADLRWLETRYSQEIRASKKELNLKLVGLTIKRYPELETQFTRIGIDVIKAKNGAANLDPNNLPQPTPGDVQEGLLA
jgi:hypothetical protein